MKPTKPRWSTERILAAPIYWTVVTDERQFAPLISELYAPEESPDLRWFAGTDASGITHSYVSSTSGLRSVVCLRNLDDLDPVAVVSLIAHEAMHVWQFVREYLGETTPSHEFEAYSVQIILQQLLGEYRRQVYGE